MPTAVVIVPVDQGAFAGMDRGHHGGDHSITARKTAMSNVLAMHLCHIVYRLHETHPRAIQTSRFTLEPFVRPIDQRASPAQIRDELGLSNSRYRIIRHGDPPLVSSGFASARSAC